MPTSAFSTTGDNLAKHLEYLRVLVGKTRASAWAAISIFHMTTCRKS